MKYGNYSVGYPSTQVAGLSLFSQPSVEMYVGGQVKDLRRLLFELVCVISEFEVIQGTLSGRRVGWDTRSSTSG